MESQRMSIPTSILSALVLMAALAGGVAAAADAEIEAGVASVEITPPRGYRMAGSFAERLNTGTRDPLHAKALVFRQGDRKAAIVFCDLVGVPRAIATEARERASRATGIPAPMIAVAATHSHTGPLYHGILRTHFQEKAIAAHGRDPQEVLDYPRQLVERVAEAIASAHRNLAPVRLEAGAARETRLAFNRRFHMKDGTVRFNPGALNPEVVRAAGPTDPEVGVLLIETPGDRRPIAGLTVFAMHLDTLGGTEYSADYPFDLEVALKRSFGPDYVSLFGAGTCGDINHIDVSKRERARTEDLGKQLAETVLAERPRLSPVSGPSLDVRSTFVTCEVQRPAAEELADARSKADLIASAKLPFLDRVRATKILDLHANYPDGTRAMEVQAFRLGPELAIVTLPGEVFVELGLAIKEQSPFRTTLVVELANDNPNYIPTEKAFREGSYEVVNSRLAPGSGERLVAAAVRLLKELGTSQR
jgi:neutral ceramidase